MPETWILVADRARARLFSLAAGAEGMDEIGNFVNPEARTPDHMLEHARRPARMHDRFGESRHAIEPRTATRDKSAARFADLLGSALELGHATRRFRHLVLIAPPRFLGTLHATLATRLREAVALRVAKNLTRRSPATILAEVPRTLRRRDRHGVRG